MPSILLIAAESVSATVAAALEQELHVEVSTAASVRAALAACFHRREYSLVLLDESFDLQADRIFQQAGATPLLEMNFAISGTQRVVRQVRAALARRDQEIAAARAAASNALNAELNTLLAGLLLESQLALREATPQQQPHLRQVVELATRLRAHLRR
jgi:CheY-like chemotaxis protein